MLTSPSKVRELIGAVQRSVVLSNGWELSTFAAQMSGLTADGIDFYTIPTLGEAKIGGADVLKVDPAAVAAFVASLTSDESGQPDTSSTDSPAPGGTTTTTNPPSSGNADRPALGMITVDVLNGSTTKGLAKDVRQRVIDKGFQGGDVGDAPEVVSSSVIRYPSGERNIAEYLAGELGGQFALAEDGSLTANHLTLVVGTNYEATPTNGLRQQPSTPSTPPSSGSTRPAPQINASGSNCVN
jgi:hypothetical protein